MLIVIAQLFSFVDTKRVEDDVWRIRRCHSDDCLYVCLPDSHTYGKSNQFDVIGKPCYMKDDVHIN